MAFGRDDSYTPQATISLSETSLGNNMMTPSTPESLYVKDEDDDLSEKKPTKKRKSWGQELPTPKTNLPPRYALRTRNGHQPQADIDIRKRAKTEDEKEQRRIERVLRNRQAAQSSRERKRQEVEKLEGEKSTIEQQNELLKERLMATEHEKFLLTQKVAKMAAQMKGFKQGSSTSSAVASPSMEPVFDHQKIKQELEDNIFNLPTPQASFGAPTVSSYSSPSSMTYSPSQSPPNVGLGLDDDSLTTSPDMTQHPAEMLCDLQCQSVEAACQASSTRSTTPPTQSSTAKILASMMLISGVYSQLMIPLVQTIFISSKMASIPP